MWEDYKIVLNTRYKAPRITALVKSITMNTDPYDNHVWKKGNKGDIVVWCNGSKPEMILKIYISWSSKAYLKHM